MGVPVKDIKILWGRSLRRCAICRKKLDAEASEASPSRVTVLGEACHIVAEKEDGPRGKSILSLEDRNRYPNLILLCEEHHTIIDSDPTAWPIERLHQIKADHELWVEQLVPTDIDDAIANVYGELVNSVTERLLLAKWPWLTDGAIRDILPEEFVDGVRDAAIHVRRTNWPHKQPALEGAVQNLADRATAYVDAFLELAYRDDQGWFREDKRWARQWVKDYDARADKAAKWQKNCSRLLMNLTHALNEFATAVRSTTRPTYFLSAGEFYILDSLGVTNGMEGAAYFPSEYQ
jgi:hypothetical protein